MKEKRSWFVHKDFESLTIIRFRSISDRTEEQSRTLQTPALLAELVQLIEHIPPEGDLMISFGPDAAYLQLVFERAGVKEIIEVIQERFKTPSTGFHSRNKEEKELYGFITGLLDAQTENL